MIYSFLSTTYLSLFCRATSITQACTAVCSTTKCKQTASRNFIAVFEFLHFARLGVFTNHALYLLRIILRRINFTAALHKILSIHCGYVVDHIFAVDMQCVKIYATLLPPTKAWLLLKTCTGLRVATT